MTTTIPWQHRERHPGHWEHLKNSDVRCPRRRNYGSWDFSICNEMVNVACWKCGWKRDPDERQATVSDGLAEPIWHGAEYRIAAMESVRKLIVDLPVEALMPKENIRGKVAKFLDAHSLAVTRGINHGVKIGDVVAITVDILDPETGEFLGSMERIRLKVADAFPQFCVAETYRLVTDEREKIVAVDIGDRVDWLE
jgi:hypothetical protein